MFNIEHVKSLVESSIESRPVVDDINEEAVELVGEFDSDMCQSVAVELQESIVDFFEFSSGASAMLIEAALGATSGDALLADKLQTISEAAEAGIKQRVVGFFRKVAAWFKALGTKILAWFSAFTNMTKTWKKKVMPQIQNASDNGAKVKVRKWSAVSIKKLGDEGMIQSGFDSLARVEEVQTDNVEAFAMGRLFSGAGISSVKDIKEYVQKTSGAKEEPTADVPIFSIKDQLLEVVTSAPEIGKAIGDACKKCAKQANDKANEYEKSFKSAKKDAKDKDGTDFAVAGAKNMMTAWGVAQKAFNAYASECQKVTKQAVRESMMALNALLRKAKKNNDDETK